MKKSYGKIILAVILIVLLAAVLIGIIINQRLKAGRIMTPSSHEQIEYLNVDTISKSQGYNMIFALYDPECEYVQLCMTVPKSDERMSQYISDMELSVDSIDREKISFAYHSEWGRRYAIILLEEVDESFSEIHFGYGGYEALITWK